MATAHSPRSAEPQTSRALPAIFWGGCACGVLDLAFALVFFTVWRGAKPGGVLRSIAGGVFGAEAQRGGAGMAALGVLFHFVISFGAAAGYWLASRKFRFLTEHAIIAGVLYGIVFYFFMHAVVLPLSAAPNAHFPPQFTLRHLPVICAHMFLVGLPIALAVRRWARTQPGSAARPSTP